MDLLIPLTLFLFIVSLIPMSAFEITSSYNQDGIPLQHYFKRPDAATYFTDTMLVSLRAKFKKEHNKRIKQTIAYSACILFIFCYVFLLDAKLLMLDLDATLFGVVFGVLYCLTSAFVFGRLGASYGRLQTTKPLNPRQRQKLESLIRKSETPQALVNFINSNTKTTLAYIDLLNVEYAEKTLTRKNEELKILGLTK